jgi:hypothetical protein
LQDCKIARGVLDAILRVVGPAGHSITRKMHSRLPGQSCNLAILRVMGQEEALR